MVKSSSLDLIRERYSCRRFDGKAIPEESLAALRLYIESFDPGPLGTRPRFTLVAALPDDFSMLRGLGTYGLIRNPSAFLVGTIGTLDSDLIDFGYLGEQAVLKATELGIGSCWLGGSFQRSRFRKSVGLTDSLESERLIACVIALGNFPCDGDARNGFIRKRLGGAYRKVGTELFYDSVWDFPLRVDSTRVDPDLLEAVRLAPSANNKQPWRLVIAPESKPERPRIHVYLVRTPGYRDNLLARISKIADLQLVDMGIALCHLAMVAADKNLNCKIARRNPSLLEADSKAQYIASLTH